MSKKKLTYPKGIDEEFRKELEEWMTHGIYEAARNQWSMTSLSKPEEKSTDSDLKDSTE